MLKNKYKDSDISKPITAAPIKFIDADNPAIDSDIFAWSTSRPTIAGSTSSDINVTEPITENTMKRDRFSIRIG